MIDWRTTLPGLIGALAILAKNVFKLDIPDEVLAGINAICLWLLGAWATSGRR